MQTSQKGFAALAGRIVLPEPAKEIKQQSENLISALHVQKQS